MSVEDDYKLIRRNQLRTAVRHSLYFLSFGLLSIAPVLLAPGLITGVSLVNLDKAALISVAAVIGSYAISLIILYLLLVFRRRTRSDFQIALIAMIFSAALIALFKYQNQEVALLVATTIVMSSICLWLFQRAALFPGLALAGLGMVSGLVVIFTDFASLSQRVTGTQLTKQNVRTAFYSLQLTTYSGRVPRSLKGGGLALFGDEYLLATGDGRLYSFTLTADTQYLNIQKLPIRVPMNTREFRSDADKRVDVRKFRVTDVHTQALSSGYRIYVAHHFWKRDKQCFVLRVSAIDGGFAEQKSGNPGQDWETVFETSPCLPLKEKGHAFAGHEAGGRIDMPDDNTLILTVGDHTFDGNGSKLILPQDDSSSYGKILSINLETGQGRILSKGHRNPQGLHIDRNQSVWSTEHGPQGGDELNLIEQGGNYGWPLETYGTAYGKTEWPLSTEQGRHRQFRAPAFAWVPSIGISNLISVGPSHFPLWDSDLIVSSLRGNALFRVRLDNERVRYVETIEVNQRIRDVLEGHDGELLLWTDRSALMTIKQTPQHENGGRLFAACAGCHTIATGTTHGLGPDLFGIGGRKSGSAANFEYSDAMRDLNVTWDRESLDRFLADPNSFLPGTSMLYAGMDDSEQRAQLVELLLNDGK